MKFVYFAKKQRFSGMKTQIILFAYHALRLIGFLNCQTTGKEYGHQNGKTRHFNNPWLNKEDHMPYLCTFEHRGEMKTTELPLLDYAIDGFWVNKWFQFTIGDDREIWIPPSKIQYVTKTN